MTLEFHCHETNVLSNKPPSRAIPHAVIPPSYSTKFMILAEGSDNRN